MSSPRKSPSGDLTEQAELRSDEDRKGIGAYISYAVLAAILVVVLCCAYRVHAFWWQS